jgi:hypothetical protein
MIDVARPSLWGVLAFWLVIAALIGARVALPTKAGTTTQTTATR